MYKHTKADLPEEIECPADSGYQGLLALHENSRTPFKKLKGGALRVEQKAMQPAIGTRACDSRTYYPAFENLSDIGRAVSQSPPLYVES